MRAWSVVDELLMKTQNLPLNIRGPGALFPSFTRILGSRRISGIQPVSTTQIFENV